MGLADRYQFFTQIGVVGNGLHGSASSCLLARATASGAWVIEAGCGLSSLKAYVGINSGYETMDHTEHRSASDLIQSLLFGSLAEY